MRCGVALLARGLVSREPSVERDVHGQLPGDPVVDVLRVGSFGDPDLVAFQGGVDRRLHGGLGVLPVAPVVEVTSIRMDTENAAEGRGRREHEQQERENYVSTDAHVGLRSPRRCRMGKGLPGDIP